MRQFILQSLAVIFLSYSALHATEAMAKNTGMRCNQCHKGRNPVLGVMPKLKSKGIRHLVKLITVEGYIPKYNYSKLNYLAATIEANRKKLEAPKKAKEPTSKSSDEAAMGADSSKEVSGGTNTSNDKFSQSKKSSDEFKPKTETKNSMVRTELQNDVSKINPKDSKDSLVQGKQFKTNPNKTVTESQKVLTSSEGKVKFKGGKTFILKRPKVKPGTKYNWEQDWSFDDYY